MMSKNGLVCFFDAGMTLLHLSCSVGSVYAEIASHYGCRVSAEALDEGFRRGWKAMQARRDLRPDSKAWWREVVRLSWKGIPVREAFPFDDYFETVFTEFGRYELWRPYPDVEEALEALKRDGVRLGVLSNWDHRLVPVLEGWELRRTFEWIILSEEVGEAKPHPGIFRVAEQAADVSSDRCALVGDDFEIDGQGCRAAGWKFFQVARPQRDLLDILSEILK